MAGAQLGLKPFRPTRPRTPSATRSLLRDLFAAFLGLLLVVSALLSVTEIVAVSERSYSYTLGRPEVLEATGLDRGQVRDLLLHVLRYAAGGGRAGTGTGSGAGAGTGDFQVLFPAGHPMAGEPVFTQREIEHMHDVRVLFAQGRAVRRAALALLGVTVVAAWLADRRRWAARGPWRGFSRRSEQGSLHFLLGSRAAFWAAGLGTSLLILVGAALTAGFSVAFDWFHLMLFTNDLWQLPEESMLITLLPLEQFQRLAVFIVAGFALCLILFVIAGRGLARRAGRGATL
jgi:hypothetical protein